MSALPGILVLMIGAATPVHAQVRAGYDARIFGGYYSQNTRAGERGPTATTWLMARAQHGRFGGDVMLSADPLLNGECGQPRLLPDSFHCGDAESLSHPLIMSLGVSGQFGAVKLTGSAVGEPAYGPPPHFMRASAQYDPGEPLTHHFFNPAHSAQGVVTVGATRAGFRVEASAFNGRHMTDRYEIDFAPLDAGAARVAWAPSSRLSVQLSAAYFPAYESGEHAHGGVMRAYSATANGQLGNLAYTVGCAAHRTVQRTPKACLAEGTLAAGIHVLFARVEAVDRLEQISVTVITPSGVHEHTTETHMLETGEIALGYGVRLPARLGWQPSIGVRGAVTAIPSFYRLRYDEQHAYAVTIFTSLRPTTSAAHHH
jgi:hypothetical protein